jgi:uncharacterized cysteine cluster protein YcgN (CxxCxxCC family)
MKAKNTNLCIDCPNPGVCCYFAAMVHGKQVKTDHPCPYLDTEAGECTIYNQRRRNPECLGLDEMIKEGTVPKWCPYVKDDPAYQARTDTRLYEFKIIEENGS